MFHGALNCDGAACSAASAENQDTEIFQVDGKLFTNRALKSGAVGAVAREFTIFLIYQNRVHSTCAASDF